jgi:hypothetical protein
MPLRPIRNQAFADGPLDQRTAQRTVQVTMQDEVLKNSVLEELANALGHPTMQVTMQVAALMDLTARTEQPREALQEAMGLANRDHFRKYYLNPLMVAGWLVRTLPDPTSRAHLKNAFGSEREVFRAQARRRNRA